jgi:hypothetical protein
MHGECFRNSLIASAPSRANRRLGRKRLLDEFPVDRRIVNHQIFKVGEFRAHLDVTAS